MCRTVHAVLSTVICGIQMLVRVFMTVILMLENLIRMLLQTFYNFVSFLLQMISLLPICCVFLITSRLKCFMCGGGGPCPVNRGGACDCLMSALAIIILFFIFRATGVLDKIFYSMGYAKAPMQVARFIPTPGDVTECSRNDTEITEYDLENYSTTPLDNLLTKLIELDETLVDTATQAQELRAADLVYDLTTIELATASDKQEPPENIPEIRLEVLPTEDTNHQLASSDVPSARVTAKVTDASILLNKLGKNFETSAFYYMMV